MGSLGGQQGDQAFNPYGGQEDSVLPSVSCTCSHCQDQQGANGGARLKAKSRIVLPGHLDPDVGEIRTDSPTTQPVAVRMAMIICVSRGWSCYLFDVTTAFLSGKHVGREIYVRPPRDFHGIRPGEVWLLLRSAYGLAEAPRLWYERARECLQEVGMEEVKFAPATFVSRRRRGKEYEVLAILCLHVHDGLLVGQPAFIEDLKEKINAKFQIKLWQTVGELPLDFLGLKIYIKAGAFFNDMTNYVLAIDEQPTLYLKKGETLVGEALKRYRRLVAQLRWPAHHVMPEFLYSVSALAQRVSRAVTEDLVSANALLVSMREAARKGQAILKMVPIGENPMLLTYFDASLGKSSETTAQRGEVHFLANSDALVKPGPAAIVEFHSNKITRVVRSSMAAECASMARAADRVVYNQKLLDALLHGNLEVPASWRTSLRSRGHLVTDAKSLYDHVHGSSLLASERQVSLDILTVRQMVQAQLLGLSWVPTWKQFADVLIKEMADELFRGFRSSNLLCVKQTAKDQAEEERRSGIRKAQRERRKVRMKDHCQHSPFGM